MTVDELIEDVDIEDAIEAPSDAADDLADLDLDLGLAEAAGEPEAPRPVEVEEEPDLEPLGFDLDFGEEPQDRTTASAAADDLGDIEGLDLDFMEEPEDLTLAKAPAGDAQTWTWRNSIWIWAWTRMKQTNSNRKPRPIWRRTWTFPNWNRQWNHLPRR